MPKTFDATPEATAAIEKLADEIVSWSNLLPSARMLIRNYSSFDSAMSNSCQDRSLLPPDDAAMLHFAVDRGTDRRARELSL